MRAETLDLWPADLRAGKSKAPATILREQGALLGRKTNNLLLGRVVPTHRESGEYATLKRLAGEQWQEPASQKAAAPPFAYSFYIVAPVLDDYAFELFSIVHGVDLYPVYTTLSRRPRRKLTAATEAEFLKHLRTIFTSEETRRVIESLLAQSQAPV